MLRPGNTIGLNAWPIARGLDLISQVFALDGACILKKKKTSL